VILWEIRGQEGTFEVYLPDNELSRATHAGGINPTVMRRAFKAAGAEEITFQLVTSAGDAIKSERQAVSDLLIWSWVPILSERAMRLATSLGCEAIEFWRCRFQSNPGETFFLHLPTTAYDIVDVENSSFLMRIPAGADLPPLPHVIQVLKTKQLPDILPSCFRASIPGHQQVFSELFVRDEFKTRWERERWTGADFRRLA
jgi:hypothetical protein